MPLPTVEEARYWTKKDIVQAIRANASSEFLRHFGLWGSVHAAAKSRNHVQLLHILEILHSYIANNAFDNSQFLLSGGELGMLGPAAPSIPPGFDSLSNTEPIDRHNGVRGDISRVSSVPADNMEILSQLLMSAGLPDTSLEGGSSLRSSPADFVPGQFTTPEPTPSEPVVENVNLDSWISQLGTFLNQSAEQVGKSPAALCPQQDDSGSVAMESIIELLLTGSANGSPGLC